MPVAFAAINGYNTMVKVFTAIRLGRGVSMIDSLLSIAKGRQSQAFVLEYMNNSAYTTCWASI